MVVVITPEERVEVCVVVVVLVGLGQAGRESVVERPPAVRIRVVSWAWTTAAARTTTRVLNKAIFLVELAGLRLRLCLNEMR